MSAYIYTEQATTECGEKLVQAIASSNPSVIFVVQASDRLKHTRGLFVSSGFEVLGRPLLVVVDEAEPDEMIEWIRRLAADFLTKPLKKIDVLPRLWRLLDQSSEAETRLLRLKEGLGMKQLLGESESFLKEIEKLPLVAKCDASVLISGETPYTVWTIKDLLNGRYSERYCLHPQASPNNCSGPIVKAHTIQRSGGLNRIASDKGFVYGFVATGADVAQHIESQCKTFRLRSPKRIGLREASTFTGFCNKHDTITFLPIERNPFRDEPEHCFLLARGPPEAEVIADK